LDGRVGKELGGLSPVLQDPEIARAGQAVLAGDDFDVGEELGTFVHKVSAPRSRSRVALMAAGYT
jgi:hypothetical protein